MLIPNVFIICNGITLPQEKKKKKKKSILLN